MGPDKRHKAEKTEDPGDQVPPMSSDGGGFASPSCHTYCWGFCGTEAAVARLLAASLALPEASFTESLSSRWCVSPAGTDKDAPELQTRDHSCTDTTQKTQSSVVSDDALVLTRWSLNDWSWCIRVVADITR